MNAYEIDLLHWSKLSIFEQMGNIYSEVGRSHNAKRNNDMKACQQATFRAIDLFDTTVDVLSQQKSPRAKEVLRAKDQFLHTIYDDVSKESIESLDHYFLNFAIAARLNR